MKIVQVVFSVKKEHITEFIDFTKTNVLNSRNENGVISFHCYQVSKNDTTFILVEQYKTDKDQLLHREANHYKTWKNAITDLLEKPYVVTDLVEIE